MSIPGSATLADITSSDWSLMLDSTAAAAGLSSGLGNVVQGLADIDQCVRIILTTPKGSDRFRPTFGCDLWQYIDQPINIVTAHIVREVYEALTTWEPRIIVESVQVAPVFDSTDQSGAHVTITITWQVNLGGTPGPTSTTIITVPQGS